MKIVELKATSEYEHRAVKEWLIDTIGEDDGIRYWYDLPNIMPVTGDRYMRYYFDYDEDATAFRLRWEGQTR